MKPQGKQKLKIFYSLTMCVISLFCIVTCSLAWFARNDDVSGTGMSVTVQKSSGLLGVEFFVEDTTVESGFLLAAEQDSVTLGKYDLLANNYRILVKVYVDGSYDNGDVQFVARTSTSYFLGDGKYPLLPELTADAVATAGYTNALSSVVGFYSLKEGDFIANSSGGYTVNGLAALESKLSKFIVDTETSGDDGTTTTTTTSVSSSVNVGTPYLMDDTYTASDGTTTNCKSMFLLVTYDKGLMTRVFTANIGNQAIAGVDEIPFAYDFTLSIEPTNA